MLAGSRVACILRTGACGSPRVALQEGARAWRDVQHSQALHKLVTVFRRCHTRRSAWADPLGCQWFGVEQHFSNRLSVILRNCLLQGCQKTSELQWCPAQSGPVVTCDLFSDAPAACCTSIASSGGADFRPVWLGLARLISGLGA